MSVWPWAVAGGALFAWMLADDASETAASTTGPAVVPAGRMLQTFGEHIRNGVRHYHYGVDLGARQGSPVYAAASGTVAGMWRNMALTGAGNTVALLHDDGRTSTTYMHLDRFRDGLHTGQRLARGELLGYVGVTDSSSDGVFDTSPPHLHFEVLSLARPSDAVHFDGRGNPPRHDPVVWARAQGVALTGGANV